MINIMFSQVQYESINDKTGLTILTKCKLPQIEPLFFLFFFLFLPFVFSSELAQHSTQLSTASSSFSSVQQCWLHEHSPEDKHKYHHYQISIRQMLQIWSIKTLAKKAQIWLAGFTQWSEIRMHRFWISPNRKQKWCLQVSRIRCNVNTVE